MLAAIKCFEVKLLLSKFFICYSPSKNTFIQTERYSEWNSLFALIDATIGPKYAHHTKIHTRYNKINRFLVPNVTFQNFEQKIVNICETDFRDFNDFLAMMEGRAAIPTEKGMALL